LAAIAHWNHALLRRVLDFERLKSKCFHRESEQESGRVMWSSETAGVNRAKSRWQWQWTRLKKQLMGAREIKLRVSILLMKAMMMERSYYVLTRA
jgi:hypothetical protein